MRLGLAMLAAFGLGGAAGAGDCRSEGFQGTQISWCVIDPKAERLQLFLNDTDGQPFGSFGRLRDRLEGAGEKLGVAMNAGMYHEDRAPVGLYIEDGKEISRIVTREGPGNFGLLPNGVFCVDAARAQVIESRAFAAAAPRCDFATQSGPMLVIDGALHPRFLPDSDSRKIRNGVGVRADGGVVLAISDTPINFYSFALFFRDRAGTPNALFLDGSVSKLYAPALGRDDAGRPMGPILGTVEPSG